MRGRRLVDVVNVDRHRISRAILCMGQARNLFSHNQRKGQSLTGGSNKWRSECRILRVNIRQCDPVGSRPCIAQALRPVAPWSRFR